MPRKARVAPGGLVYHVLNRAAGRITLFRQDEDYHAFERVMLLAHERIPLRILSWCLMPNHWHFVVWPREDGELSAFFRWLSHTHAMRWRVAHRAVGHGPLYQGRFKSFPIQEDEHLLNVCRYVERNPLSAGLVQRAQRWAFSSLAIREKPDQPLGRLLAPWPVDRPRRWAEAVNAAWTAKELSRLEESERRGRPYGSDAWTQRMASRYDLGHTLRHEGRPAKS